MAIPANTVQTSFNAGEISPYLRGQIRLEKYRDGVIEMKNFVALPQGGVTLRTGTARITSALISSEVVSEETVLRNVRLIGFSPNSRNTYVLEFGHEYIRVISREGPVTLVDPEDEDETIASITAPWGSDDLAELTVTYSVDVMIICHPSYAPYILKRLAADTFTLAPVVFSHPPTKRTETNGASLIVSNEERYVRLTSTTGTEFDAIGAFAYVEWQEDGEWRLGRKLTTSTTPAAPANPAGGVCYVEPVRSTVENFPINALTTYELTADNDEIGADRAYILSDTAAFNFDLVGSWYRFRPTFPDVRNASRSDGVSRWVRVLEYKGQYDRPTEWLIGASVVAGDFESGATYRIVERGGITAQVGMAGTSGNPSAPDTSTGFHYSTNKDTFQWVNYARLVNAAGAGTVISNLSSQKAFDVVETELPVTVYKPVGTIAVDPLGSKWTASLAFNKPFLGTDTKGPVGDDVGRHIQAKFGDGWTLFKITAAANSQSCDVDVLSAIPVDPKSAEYINEGISTEYRLSHWHAGNWPFCAAFHEQRLVFGGSPRAPQTLFLSSLTDTYNFSTVENDGNVLDTTGIQYELSVRQLSRVSWLTSGPVLLIGSESGEYQVRSSSFNEPITPTNIRITEETAIGAGPNFLRIGSSTFFASRSGSQFFEFRYNYEIDGYESIDVTLMSDHLFKRDPIIAFDFQLFPRPVIWVVTLSGALFGLTYVKEQGIYAWHRHSLGTGGSSTKILSVATRYGTGGKEDEVWLAVRRGGEEVHLERMYDSFVDDPPVPQYYTGEIITGLPAGVVIEEPWTFTETGTINWLGGNVDGTEAGAPPSASKTYTHDFNITESDLESLSVRFSEAPLSPLDCTPEVVQVNSADDVINLVDKEEALRWLQNITSFSGYFIVESWATLVDNGVEVGRAETTGAIRIEAESQEAPVDRTCTITPVVDSKALNDSLMLGDADEEHTSAFYLAANTTTTVHILEDVKEYRIGEVSLGYSLPIRLFYLTSTSSWDDGYGPTTGLSAGSHQRLRLDSGLRPTTHTPSDPNHKYETVVLGGVSLQLYVGWRPSETDEIDDGIDVWEAVASTTTHAFISGAQFLDVHPPDFRWSFPTATNPLNLQFTLEDDSNCDVGKTEEFQLWNPHTQSGTAHCRIRVSEEGLSRMLVSWGGEGETNSTHERLSFEYKLAENADYIPFDSARSPGGGLGCAGGVDDVVSDFVGSPFLDLIPGALYDIRVTFTSHDSLFHNGAFYQFFLTFFSTGLTVDQYLALEGDNRDPDYFARSPYRSNICFLDYSFRTPFEPGTFLAEPVSSVTPGVKYDGLDLSLIIDGEHIAGVFRTTAGALTLPKAAEKYVLLGLPFGARMVLMPFNQDLPSGAGYGQIHRIHRVLFYLYESLGFSMGMNNRQPYMVYDPPGGSSGLQPLLTGFTSPVSLDSESAIDGQLVVEHSEPYPLTILSAILELTSNPRQ